ncbi:MAG: hypothetical protein WC661_20060 [Opitutaceae bacterium]|jgi:hypothetical protein
MKSTQSARLVLALVLGFCAASISFAADAFDLAKAKAAYPLTTCVVSGEALADGDMGPPIDYVYKAEGQPDRLVRFCCKMCVGKFKKDPAKYLKVIDDAAAAKAKATPVASTSAGCPAGSQMGCCAQPGV